MGSLTTPITTSLHLSERGEKNAVAEQKSVGRPQNRILKAIPIQVKNCSRTSPKDLKIDFYVSLRVVFNSTYNLTTFNKGRRKTYSVFYSKANKDEIIVFL